MIFNGFKRGSQKNMIFLWIFQDGSDIFGSHD